MITDLLLRVLAAAVVGVAAGWLIKSVFATGRFKRAERSWLRQLEAGNNELDALRHKAESLEPRSRQLELRNQELEDSFAKVQGELLRIKASFTKREESIAELREGLLHAQKHLQDTDKLKAKLAAQDKKLKQMVGLRSELFERALHLSEMDSLKAELETLSRRATHLETENAELHGQRSRLDENLTLAKERISGLMSALETTRAHIGTPPTESPAAAEQIVQLQERLKDRNEAVAEMRADLDRLTNNYQKRIRDLERRIGDGGRGITALIDADKPPTLGRSVVPEAAVDDMTQISGIGPVLEQTLNSLGIQSFRQLAELTSKDIEQMSHQLGPFKSRLLRDDWIGQAQRLHRQKYGRKLKV